MCSSPAEIAWLACEMVNVVGEWNGPKELRGVFCSRYRPADGIEMDSTHPAYTADAGEQRSLEAPVRLMLTAAPDQQNHEPFKIDPRILAKFELPPEERRKPRTRLDNGLAGRSIAQRLKDMGL
jgi:hypothetical protein